MSRCAAIVFIFIMSIGAVGLTLSAADTPTAAQSPSTPPRASPAPPAPGPTGDAMCTPMPFAATTPVPEASGAGWLEIDGKLRLIVVGDSGRDGAYGVLDPATGETGETGKLPLASDTTDDLEGVATRGGKLYAVTSAGWIYTWQRSTQPPRFTLVGKPYPLGPVTLPDTKNNDRAPDGTGMVCNAKVVNCGRNYEGLCLAPSKVAPGGCVGFAASKADGHLYCLTERAGQLVAHYERRIKITRPGALADCAFSDDGTLWAGSNMFDLAYAYRVVKWEDPATAVVERVAALTAGFPELIAARRDGDADIVYRMSDTGGAPSAMSKYRCRR